MIQIYKNLYVGEDFECFDDKEKWVTVHACKSPCHQRIIGYRGSLPSNHPHYLVYENDRNLYLNIIDPPIPLFKLELFTTFLKFGAKHYKEEKLIFIHCNRGESRAPSLALLFLAKHLKAIDNNSYQTAMSEFAAIYPQYNPGNGIRKFLTENWTIIK